MKRLDYHLSACLLCGVLSLVALITFAADAPRAPSTNPTTVPAAKLDLDKAVPVALPALKDLEPTGFKTPDGRVGWAVRLPGNRPVATPAYANGMLFLGGGYGSHEFYAFNADSGTLVWQARTSDDGPTAAVVEDGLVAYNTESCTVIVCQAKTGKVVWQEWLGDPLMSQPAIDKGRLFIAYPGGHPRGPVQGEGQNGASVQSGPAAAPAAINAAAPAAQAGGAASEAPAAGHRMLCADLKTGRHLWQQEITADVISAPAVEDGKVYFTCFDGTGFCLNETDGAVVWKKANSGTSAPLVTGGQLVVAQKQQAADQLMEGLRRMEISQGKEKDNQPLAMGKAEYFRAGKDGAVALSSASQLAQDSSVGFASAPASAGLAAASMNNNVGTVAGAWAYQGSRPSQNAGMLMNAQGGAFNGVHAADGSVAWRAEAMGRDVDPNVQLFSPPSLGAKNLYTVSTKGHLLCLGQGDGALRFAYHFDAPMAFQPALAKGNIYVATANGTLICLKTGEGDADGWYAWGGNARHNK